MLLFPNQVKSVESGEFESGDDLNAASTIDIEYSEFSETTSIRDEIEGDTTATYISNSELIAAETDMNNNNPTGSELAGITATSNSNHLIMSFVFYTSTLLS